MRRNTNYFGDVSQFFLKAKKEENFVLDPKIKNELREKLSLKINEIKNAVIEKDIQDIDETPVSGGFWTLWKRQLISVPASLFALVMIVFAANNFNFSLQTKEDFSPTTEKTTDLQTTLLDTTVPDSALIAETTPVETEKPELLVLNINELGSNSTLPERNLNKYQPPAETPKTTEPAVYQSQTTTTTEQQPANQQTEKIVSSTSQQNNNTTSTASTAATAPKTQTSTQSKTTTSTSTTAQTAQPSNTTTTSSAQTTQQSVSETQSDTSSDTTATQTQTEQPETITTQPASTTPPAEIISAIPATTGTITATQQLEDQTVLPETVTSAATMINLNADLIENAEVGFQTTAYTLVKTSLNDYIKDNTVLVQKVRTREYTINYYTNSSGQKQPEFDRSIIAEVTSGKSPSAVNIYYISETQVLVEVIEGTTKKLYLYENKGEGWTVIKYEKN